MLYRNDAHLKSCAARVMVISEQGIEAINAATIWMTASELDTQPELVKTMSMQPPPGASQVR